MELFPNYTPILVPFGGQSVTHILEGMVVTEPYHHLSPHLITQNTKSEDNLSSPK